MAPIWAFPLVLFYMIGFSSFRWTSRGKDEFDVPLADVVPNVNRLLKRRFGSKVLLRTCNEMELIVLSRLLLPCPLGHVTFAVRHLHLGGLWQCILPKSMDIEHWSSTSPWMDVVPIVGEIFILGSGFALMYAHRLCAWTARVLVFLLCLLRRCNYLMRMTNDAPVS